MSDQLGPGAERDEQPLARALGELATDMHAQRDNAALLQTIVEATVHIVPGTRWAGISLIEGRQVTPRVPSDPLVAELDELQRRQDEGPCLSALRDHETVRIDNTAADERWPKYARAARERGVHSVLSFRLFVERQTLGSLNLYADHEDAFDDDALAIGGIVAQHAAVAMIGSAAEAQFQTALAGRDVIGQAKGILMHRDGLTGLQAFALLTRVSQRTNTRLLAVARFLVEDQESNARRPDQQG
ncbi:GAF and ANTAR domain-containing protein [Mycobacterium montefiorense]|uniref:GAF and ANTAR domain-containing protein n=1 Tax=Mycobacterium montefiorense TaxID=154654 RepID=UPI0021F28867|nr:GAF and ANTAR domain-containing protein [Mycobacterium montefiorense]MCV7427062.1 GAF and ANTAR domain-containing protein [Mycobacterium montefiorense]